MSCRRSLAQPKMAQVPATPHSSEHPGVSAPGQFAPVCALLVLLVLVALNAWVCDDAFITLRSAKNLVEGRGPVFNAPWRVQSFTHPAWMVLLALAWSLTREALFTSMGLGLLTSAAAVYLVLRRCVSVRALVLVLVGLGCSRAFVEYSSSGLENPLTHLIIGLGALSCVRVTELEGEHPRELERALLVAGLLLSAAFLSRPDALLLLAPLFVYVMRRARTLAPARFARACLLGAAPALAWECFALIYYGSPLPNTALAKLGVGIPRAELLARGLAYLWHTASSDPASFMVLLFGLSLPWWPTRLLARVGEPGSDPQILRPLARGALAYLVYVVAIGGGFMEGRFLSAPIVCAALVLARVRWSPSALAVLGLLCGLLASRGTRPPWQLELGAEPRRVAGIADERSHYAEGASLMAWKPGRELPVHRWREQGEQGPLLEPGAERRVAVFSTLGLYGYYADPEVHVVDAFGLADPLLARLPPVRRVDWKAGHLPRVLPEGYVDTLRGQGWELSIRDPAIAELYVTLARVHLGPMFAAGRGQAMWALLSGRASEGLDRHALHFAELERVELRQLERRAKLHRFRDAGVELELDPEHAGGDLQLLLSPGQRYAVIFHDASGRELGREERETEGTPEGEPTRLQLQLPAGEVARVHLLPLTMHGRRSLVVLAERRSRGDLAPVE